MTPANRARIGLIFWCRLPERPQPRTMRMDAQERLQVRRVARGPLGRVDLRDHADVGRRRLILVATAPGFGVLRDQCFQRIEALHDPVAKPALLIIRGRDQFAVEVVDHPRGDERMDVARDELGECPHALTLTCFGRQEPRCRAYLVEVLDDRQRLREHATTVD